MDFETIVKTRYATKKFDGKVIPDNKIQELFELIRLAPSSFNIQPWAIKVVTDQSIKNQIQDASWNQVQVGTSSHVLVFCARTDINEQITRLEETLKKNSPSNTLSGYIKMMRDFDNNMSKEARLSWAQRQVYLALGNALNGAKHLGFDSCPMEGFDPVKVANILNLPAHIVPTVLCPIGFAADTSGNKIRFEKEVVFI